MQREADSGTVQFLKLFGIRMPELEKANRVLVEQEQNVARERVSTSFCVSDFSCKHLSNKGGAKDQLIKLAHSVP